MQLETYISDLLYRYDCVVVPEFGAFITERQSATINKNTNTFYPPRKVIAFNERIQNNDGLLARYIADVEKIPFDVAVKKIKKRVKTLKSYLTQGETITFNNIGEIIFNAEGKIVFEPSYNLNYLTNAFGLSQFQSEAVIREVHKEKVVAIEETTPIAVTPEKRKSRGYLKYAAVALIALSLGGVAASKYYVDRINEHNMLADEQAKQQLDAKIQEATFSLNPLPAITLNVTKQTGNYHIIAGAFRVEENCNKKVSQLKADGFSARKLGMNKYGLYEVVYASYENRVDALTALRDIKKNHNKDAWLKVQRLDNPKPLSYSAQKKVESHTESFEETSIFLNPGKNQLKTNPSYIFDNSPNIIPILREIDKIESGFYNVIAILDTAEEKDKFLKSLPTTVSNTTGAFFDRNSQKYFVFTQKFNDLQSAKNSLETQKTLSFVKNIAIVKVEN
ncbi:MAG: SPOR domain-containing protein [Jejuia sp.]